MFSKGAVASIALFFRVAFVGWVAFVHLYL